MPPAFVHRDGSKPKRACGGADHIAAVVDRQGAAIVAARERSQVLHRIVACPKEGSGASGAGRVAHDVAPIVDSDGFALRIALESAEILHAPAAGPEKGASLLQTRRATDHAAGVVDGESAAGNAIREGAKTLYLAVRRPEHRLDSSRPTRVSGRLVVPIDPERFAAGVPGKRAEIHNLAVGFSEEGAQGIRAVRGADDGAQFVDTETRAPIGRSSIAGSNPVRDSLNARCLPPVVAAPPIISSAEFRPRTMKACALVEGAEVDDLIHLSAGDARRDEAQESDQEQDAGKA